MSDSEDLEFESADEDQKEDLSDLDIDEILNETDEQQPINKSKDKNQQQQQKSESEELPTKTTTTTTKVEETKSVEAVTKALEDLETKQEISKPPVSSIDDKDLIKTEVVQEIGKNEEKKESAVKSASAWDESNLSDVEDEDLLETTKEQSTEEAKKEQTERKTVEKKVTETGWGSGWDDLEFTDIDNKTTSDNDKSSSDKTNTPIPQVEPRKVIEEKKSTTKEDVRPQNTWSQQQQLKQQQQQQQEQQQQQANSGVGGWSWSKLGTNLLSSAATITMQMMETVEASLGAPDPQELAARIAKSEEEQKATAKTDDTENDKSKEEKPNNNDDWKFDNSDSDWFSINKITSTGTNLITGSLDVLESVGKKTFEMINDKDPNFKQTRELLKKVPINTAKPNLSQLLREAQSQNESKSSSNETQMTSSSSQSSINKSSPKAVERSSKQEKISFSLFFEEYKGTAHLEALEMLSSQAKVKIELLAMERPISRYSEAIKSELKRIERMFDEKRLNNEDDDEEDEDEEDEEIRRELERLTDDRDGSKMLDLSRIETLARQFSSRSNLISNIDKMVAAFKTASLASREPLSPNELFNESIKCFALITSNMIELFHKAAEAVFVELENSKMKIKREQVLENVDCLYRITKLSIKGVTILSNDYSKSCKINAKQLNESNPNHIITDIYLEASNSCAFIGDGYLLFLPIFKYLLLKTENA